MILSTCVTFCYRQEAIEKKEDVLKAAAEGRKFSIALKQCNYSGELVSGMMNFSTKMEKSLRRLQNWVLKTFPMKSVGTKSWIASMHKWHGIPLLRLGYPWWLHVFLMASNANRSNSQKNDQTCFYVLNWNSRANPTTLFTASIP